MSHEVHSEPLLTESGRFRRFYTDHGELITAYDAPSGWYTLSTIDVAPEHRRRGIGKDLLRASESHARSVGATVIYAAITSRELLDAVVSVFGADGIDVADEGQYHPPEQFANLLMGDTVAIMRHELT